MGRHWEGGLGRQEGGNPILLPVRDEGSAPGPARSRLVLKRGGLLGEERVGFRGSHSDGVKEILAAIRAKFQVRFTPTETEMLQTTRSRSSQVKNQVPEGLRLHFVVS